MITTPAYVSHSICGFWKLSVSWLVGNGRSQDCRRPENSAGREDIRRLVSAFVNVSIPSWPFTATLRHVTCCTAADIIGYVSAVAVIDSFTWQQMHTGSSALLCCAIPFFTSLF